MGSCPQGHPVPAGFDFCGTCGEQVPVSDVAPPQVAPPTMTPLTLPPVERRPIPPMAPAQTPGATATATPRATTTATPSETAMTTAPISQPAPASRETEPVIVARPRPDSSSPAPRNGLGRTAAILGGLSLLTAPILGLGIIAGVLAVAFGEAGLARERVGTATNRRTAGWGIVLGLVGAILSLALLRYYQLLADSGSILIG